MNRSVRRRGSAMVKVIIAAAGLAVIGTGGFAVWATLQDDSAAVAQSARDLSVAAVRDFEITTLANGQLDARNQIELRSQLDATSTIVQVVPEGTRVQAGELLVELNSDELRDEIAEEELRVAQAQLDLDGAATQLEIQKSDNDSSLRRAELALELAELALEQWSSGDHKRQIEQLALAVERTERDRLRLERKLKESEALFEQTFISFDELERDRIAKLEADAAAKRAVLDQQIYIEYQFPRDKAQKESDVTEALAEVERVKKENAINLKNRESSVDNRQQQLDRRTEKLAELRGQLEKTKIFAPTAGLVVYASTIREDRRRGNDDPIAIGAQVRPNELIMVLPDTSEMVASVLVHEAIAGSVRPGQPASIKIDAANTTLPGTVDSVGVIAETGGWRDPNRREYRVIVSLSAGAAVGDLKPSMRCETELLLGNVTDALSVPVQAVYNEGPVRYVLVPAGARFDRKPVMLGRRSDLFAEIAAGLDEGQQVLIRQPRTGEVDMTPFTPEELAAAGYAIAEDGSVISPRAMPGRGRPSGQPGGQGQNANAAGGAASQPTQTEQAAAQTNGAAPKTAAPEASQAAPGQTEVAAAGTDREDDAPAEAEADDTTVSGD